MKHCVLWHDRVANRLLFGSCSHFRPVDCRHWLDRRPPTAPVTLRAAWVSDVICCMGKLSFYSVFLFLDLKRCALFWPSLSRDRERTIPHNRASSFVLR